MIPLLRRGTLRLRLAVWYSIGGVLLFAAFSGAIYWFVAYRLARPLDYNLRRDLAQIRTRLEVSGNGTVRWDKKILTKGAPWSESYPWFELWDPHGQLVVRLWPLDEVRLKRVPTPPVRNRETIAVFRVADETRLRVLSVPFDVQGTDQKWMLRVIRMHQPAAEALGALLLIIVIALPVVVSLLVLGGYRVTRHWLKPLDALVAATGKVSAESLTTRLTVPNPNDELGQLATAFNMTLARLERSFTTLDRFVADASHELRTPLTALRNVGEVGLSYERSPAEYREVIGSMLEEAQRLQQLVDRLLQLARAEGGEQPAELGHHRLDEIVLQSVEKLRVLADEKQQLVEVKAAPCTAEVDPVLFEQAFQNLFGNAIKYCPTGALIQIIVIESRDWFAVVVLDNGPGIDPAHRAQLTDRFFRGDDSRACMRGGFGLGLALAKAYMQTLGGGLGYEPVEPHGCRFKLTLPKASGRPG